MSLSDKRQWFLHDMDDYHSGKNGYYEDDLKASIKELKDGMANGEDFYDLMNEIFGDDLT